MTASLAEVRAAPKVDRYEVVATLVAAFRDDRAARALYPTDLEYVRFFPGFLMAFGGPAFANGTVDQDAEGRAAALWFSPGVRPDGEAVMNHLEVSVPASRLAPLARGYESRANARPEEPHWYLTWMGVVPEAQGMGIGGALLREGLARAAAEGMPVYLEATTRRAAAFYARHGFATRATICLPRYPEIITMWRPAH
ncbi:MAG TPA: GNAT family N-acetyltransferase [Bauldia sp.]|nr:GNAT family N-acetyltransferase [Bauldia sp.]